VNINTDITLEEFRTLIDFYKELKNSKQHNDVVPVISKIIESVKVSAYHERNKRIYEMYKKGHTYKEISEQVNLTPSAIQRICWTNDVTWKRMDECPDKMPFLICLNKSCEDFNFVNTRPTRIYNVLYKNNLVNRDETIVDLDKVSDDYLLSLRDIGKKSLAIIRYAYEIYLANNYGEKYGNDNRNTNR